jgi:hypothetical protein
MMLPSEELAQIDPAKVRDYLLSQTHPVGRFKAVVFLTLGYTATNWELLRDDLLALAGQGSCVAGQFSQFGQKYEVSGTLCGPNGRQARFVTVWLLPSATDVPRFITAFPG